MSNPKEGKMPDAREWADHVIVAHGLAKLSVDEVAELLLVYRREVLRAAAQRYRDRGGYSDIVGELLDMAEEK